MFAIEVRFLRGSYHATPWGTHVNDGIPEWPPSLWRLVRAMVHSWKTNFPDLPEDKVWPTLQKIAGEIPCYNLPDASVSRSRYHVPARTKSTLVTETFVIMGDMPVDIVWRNVVLDAGEIDMVRDILGKIRYFGRAESRCTMNVIARKECNCKPLPDVASDEAKTVRVLAPRPDVSFVDMHAGTEHAMLETISVTTKIMQEKNHADPPGGMYVRYNSPKNLLLQGTAGDARSSNLHDIALVRYAIVGKVRLPVTEALRVGDAARTACMSRYGMMRNGHTSCIFAGKDAGGRPLADHRHASYLPTCETHAGMIDHLTIVAIGGFDRHELDVLFGLNRLYGRGLPRMRLVFQGCGTPSSFASVPILKASKRWVSVTPMILTRHAKYRGGGECRKMVDGPEEQIRRELTIRHGDAYDPAHVVVEGSQAALHGTSAKPTEFHRWRSHGSIGDKTPYKVRLEFREEVPGPISLGYASHYGLGMFVPEE